MLPVESFGSLVSTVLEIDTVIEDPGALNLLAAYATVEFHAADRGNVVAVQ